MVKRNNSSKKHAFTFLEFLVVVGIIGILAAIAIPTYGEYVIRSKAKRMLKDTEGLKAAVTDYKAIHGKFLNAITDNEFEEIYGVENPTLDSNVIDKVQVKSLGASKVSITILATGKRLSLKEGKSLRLKLEGTWSKGEGIDWVCTSRGQEQYAPKICQEKKPPKKAASSKTANKALAKSSKKKKTNKQESKE